MGSLHPFSANRLANGAAYCAALDELAELLLVDPDSPARQRVVELVEAIEHYEATHLRVPDWPASSACAPPQRAARRPAGSFRKPAG